MLRTIHKVKMMANTFKLRSANSSKSLKSIKTIGVNFNAINKGIICAMFRGTLFFTKKSSKFVLERDANCEKTPMSIFLMIKSIQNMMMNNETASESILRYAAVVVEIPIPMK